MSQVVKLQRFFLALLVAVSISLQPYALSQTGIQRNEAQAVVVLAPAAYAAVGALALCTGVVLTDQQLNNGELMQSLTDACSSAVGVATDAVDFVAKIAMGCSATSALGTALSSWITANKGTGESEVQITGFSENLPLGSMIPNIAWSDSTSWILCHKFGTSLGSEFVYSDTNVVRAYYYNGYWNYLLGYSSESGLTYTSYESFNYDKDGNFTGQSTVNNDYASSFSAKNQSYFAVNENWTGTIYYYSNYRMTKVIATCTAGVWSGSYDRTSSGVYLPDAFDVPGSGSWVGNADKVLGTDDLQVSLPDVMNLGQSIANGDVTGSADIYSHAGTNAGVVDTDIDWTGDTADIATDTPATNITGTTSAGDIWSPIASPTTAQGWFEKISTIPFDTLFPFSIVPDLGKLINHLLNTGGEAEFSPTNAKISVNLGEYLNNYDMEIDLTRFISVTQFPIRVFFSVSALISVIALARRIFNM